MDLIKKSKNEYYLKNKKIILIKQKQYYQKNKEKIMERNKKYREENRELYNKSSIKYYKENIERRKKLDAEYYQKNKQKINNRKKRLERKKGYSYDKSPFRKLKKDIRDKTRYKYPITIQKCKFCENKAEERHHTTEPIKLDKFVFVCKKCHYKIHNQKFNITLDRKVKL